MRGHITKKGNNYYVVVDIGRDHRNKRKQKWFSGFKSKKAAENALPKILLSLEDGYKDPENMTFEAYLQLWLKRKKNSVSLGTYQHYESYTRNHIIPGLGKWKISKLEQHLIDSFVEDVKEKDLSPRTKRHIYRVLVIAIKAGKRYGLKESLLDDVESPKSGRQEIICLTSDEVVRFTDALKSKNHRLPIMLALATGMRYGEVMGLQWDNVDLDKGTISVSHQLKLEELEDGSLDWVLSPVLKTKTSYRTIKIDDNTVNMLKERKKQQDRNRFEVGADYIENGLVCTITTGEFMRPTYITTVMNKAIEKAKVSKITFHGLRHTHATLLLADGIHPKIVQERLGHGSIQITLDTYSHITPGIQEAAALSIGNSLYKKAESENGNTPKDNVVNFDDFV